MVLSWADLGVAVGTNMLIVVVVFFVFNYLRRMSLLSDFYSAKRKLSIPFRFRPPRLPPTLFTWMGPVFSMRPEKFAACAGFDALAYVQALSLMLRVSAWVALVVVVMVLPTNWTGSAVEKKLAIQESDPVFQQLCSEVPTGEAEDELLKSSALPSCPKAAVADFDETSMTNLDDSAGESRRLWVHLIALNIITYIVLKLLWAHYEETVRWRMLYLAWTRKGDAAHTVLVTDIPGTPSGTIVGRIYDNLDSTLGRLLPKSVTDKVKLAMHKGVGSVFGAADKLQLTSKAALFKDDKYDVYTRGYPAPRSELPPLGTGGDEEFVQAPERLSRVGSTNSFGSAKFYDAASMSGSFMSSVSLGGADAGASSGNPIELGQAAEGVAAHSTPPPTVAGRRNLRYFESRPPPTDFETWEQAEAALQAGVAMPELVSREFVRDFGPDAVTCVSVVKNEMRLSKLTGKYAQTKGELEDLSDAWLQSLRRKKKVKRKTVKVNTKGDEAAEQKWGPGKVKVDEMDYKMWLLGDLQDKIRAERARAVREDTCSAFVTMSSRQLQSQVAMGMVSYHEGYWATTTAPSPGEIIWPNVQYRGWERRVREMVSWGVLVTLVLCFIPIVGVVQSLVNLEQMGGEVTKTIVNIPFLGQFIQGFLPTAGLKIVLALVPIVLKLVSNFVAGNYSWATVDFDVARKYFIFQVFVVFVIVTLFGTASTGSSIEAELARAKVLIAAQEARAAAEAAGAPVPPLPSAEEASDFAAVDFFKSLIDDPAAIANKLGSAIPQQASFYIIYILVNGLSAKGIAFLRIPGAVIFFLLQRLAGTKRQKKKTWSQQYMWYSPEIPDHTITMLLLFVFSIAQPFIAVVAVAYFATNYFYARYDLLYTKREKFQTGGLIWRVVFEQIYFGLLLGQIGNAALFGIKGFGLGVPLSIPAIVFTVLFRINVAKSFARPMQTLAFHSAADFDRADKFYDWMKDTLPEEEEEMRSHNWDLEDVRFGPPSERYKQPSLISRTAEHTRVLREAEGIRRKVEAFNSGAAGHTDEPIMVESDDDNSEENTQLGSPTAHPGSPVLAVGNPPPAFALSSKV